MKLVEHVPLLGQTRNAQKDVLENQDLRENWEDLDVDMTISKWMLKIEGGAAWAGVIWLKTGTCVGVFEHGNKHCCLQRCDDVQSGKTTDCSADIVSFILLGENQDKVPSQRC